MFYVFFLSHVSLVGDTVISTNASQKEGRAVDPRDPDPRNK